MGAAFAMLVLVAAPARAHMMTTGMGPFYDGLAHFFATPEDLLSAFALILLAGLRGPRFGRAILFVLPAAWLAGSLAGRLAQPRVTLAAATAVFTIALGALVAADAPLSLGWVAMLAVFLGLLHGGLNGAELAKAGASALPAVGVSAALFLAASLLAGQVSSLKAPWARIVVRVAGSWIAASGLFMLGWAVRGKL